MTDRLLTDAEAAPILTERLRLRPMAAKDWPHWPAFYASDRSRFVGGPLDRPQAWFKVAQLIGHASMRGYGHWSVETHDGEYLGRVGLEHADGWEYIELGWTFLESASGKGYATEAGRAMRDHAFQHVLPFVPTANSLCSLIDPDNAPSQRVATRLGAAPDPSAPAYFPNTVAWRHPTPAEAVA
ncbi:MAG: GNAT family N-acetyltransferase [Pseudomonadota bacterium]